MDRRDFLKRAAAVSGAVIVGSKSADVFGEAFDLQGKDSQLWRTLGDVFLPNVVEVETDGLNPQHNGVLAAFANKILGMGDLIASGCEGINGLTISNALHLSSWLDTTVDLPLAEDLFLEELTKRRATSTVLSRQPSSMIRYSMGSTPSMCFGRSLRAISRVSASL